MNEQPTQKPYAGPPPPPPPLPGMTMAPMKPRRRKSRKGRVILWSVLLFLLVVGGGVAYGIYYIESNVLIPASHFVHPVGRSQDEPPVPTYSESAITSHAWNILLM
ncbi:MAG TPA: hypothetical protein VGS41_19035, partial [Chthonomonadales bacterium]|nr:hypothetical protein [Chthonomonadales bacterium]